MIEEILKLAFEFVAMFEKKKQNSKPVKNNKWKRIKEQEEWKREDNRKVRSEKKWEKFTQVCVEI